MKTREIRFRVFDLRKGRYIPDDVYCLFNRTSFDAFGQMLLDWEDYREGEYFYDDSQLLEQSTGLTDKNGKEIFEGDIVRGGIYLAYEVKWEYEECGWNIGESVRLFEICGNIHDNPELLI